MEPRIEIYTDGACSQNPGPGGWAFVIVNTKAGDSTEIYRGCGAEKSTTNNRMELQAVINALQLYTDKMRVPEYDSMSLSVHTDSQYVKQGISLWIKNWKKNGWRTASKQPVKNQDLWQELDRLAQISQPEWVWVKAHAGNRYNELCDSLAVEAKTAQFSC